MDEVPEKFGAIVFTDVGRREVTAQLSFNGGEKGRLATHKNKQRVETILQRSPK
jgi:hypothetical protein